MQMSRDRGLGGGGREKVTRGRDPAQFRGEGEQGSGPGGAGGAGGSTGECPDVPARASREPAGARRSPQARPPPEPTPTPTPKRAPLLRPQVQGLEAPRGWGTPCECLSPGGCSPRDPLLLRPHPSASASSPCLLRPLAHPRHHPLRAGASSAASAQCAWGGVGATRTFLPLLSPGCPLPRPPHLWDVSWPTECLVGPLGWSKRSFRVP